MKLEWITTSTTTVQHTSVFQVSLEYILLPPSHGQLAITVRGAFVTKFEECSFIRYRYIEGVPKFRNWARQGHWKYHPSIERIRLPIDVL